MKTLTDADQPAFPIDCGEVVFTGLTKREEFAKSFLAAAIMRNGICSHDYTAYAIAQADKLIKSLNETAEERPEPSWAKEQNEKFVQRIKDAAARARKAHNGYDIFGNPQ